MLHAPSCKYLGNCLLLATHCYFSQVSFQTNSLPATSFKYPPEGRRGRMTGACQARGWRKICYPLAELRFAFSLHSLPSSLSFIPSPPSPGSTMLTSSPGRSRAWPFGKASDGGYVCGAFVVVLCHHEPAAADRGQCDSICVCHWTCQHYPRQPLERRWFDLLSTKLLYPCVSLTPYRL